ncbi:hypothetical protein EKO27_g10065 [Xylaria grammica]|uniref:Heterokaryon incompatibility domain-containing protein n=1 Tax=Xylaria grammica TaxID=363999 RepID=A0A439CSA9_9PEZI|nr:hypothetical protein EKO27_g10065 [Xylaria grammica]
MTSRYEHQPLTLPKSIRVLTLEPAISEKAPIRCSLEEVDLDNITPPPSYEALSYVWGEKVGTIPIECHGKQLLVTPNCYDAIVNLRRKFYRRRLFLDAICIDQRQGQQQEIERGRQIPLMGESLFAFSASYFFGSWKGIPVVGLPAAKSHPFPARWAKSIRQWGPFFECVSGYEILSIVFHLDSTRQEDKIFGLYAIFDRAGLKLPDPDTSKPVAEVFEDATRVPYLNGDRFMDDGRYYDSSKGRSRATNRDIMIGELHCPGTIVGKVNFLVSPTILTQREELDLTCIEACRKWFQHISSSSTYCTGGSIIDAAKRTLQFGVKEDERRGVVLFSKWFDLMLYPNCKIYGPGEYEKEASSLPVYEAQTSPLGNDSAMMLIMTLLNSGGYGGMWLELMEWSNYALMVLDTGHFARGFRVCKKGDVVALLAGCEVPVALRPDGKGNYIFVALLYADGIMNGEAWPDDESELEEIKLV